MAVVLHRRLALESGLESWRELDGGRRERGRGILGLGLADGEATTPDLSQQQRQVIGCSLDFEVQTQFRDCHPNEAAEEGHADSS